jgi:hypothetical protein
MRRAKAVIFVVGLALVAFGGYVPWYYADQTETFRVALSPLFVSDFYTPFGLLLKTMSIITWGGGLVLLLYLISPEKERW